MSEDQKRQAEHKESKSADTQYQEIIANTREQLHRNAGREQLLGFGLMVVGVFSAVAGFTMHFVAESDRIPPSPLDARPPILQPDAAIKLMAMGVGAMLTGSHMMSKVWSRDHNREIEEQARQLNPRFRGA
ncbi:MAG TPA: hypothetical protein VHE99_00940 [Gammaproteobacteria bacterium]|nr:hypothetical protein [Gammaproteobacteria bacterium]